ncbi:TetR/AcrR family transcriptional regulator [Clostridium pasteurianum]|nr:TetR/AcrR family transcriptional regulator [Clostridium pasteurianum]
MPNNRYKNASTNEIVKKANISKGLLFHYFSSKKKLFLFLYEYSKDIFLNEFYNKVNYDETDIIKRWKQIVTLEMELIQKYPVLYDFMLTSSADDSKEVKQELENQMKSILEDSYIRLFSNIDTSKFKDGVDAKRISQIIFWVAQGFSNRELEYLKRDPVYYKSHINMDDIVKEFELYLEMLKDAFYK